MSCVPFNPFCLKLIMGLAPEVLLSSASQARCIANIYKLPAINLGGGMHPHDASVLVPICVYNGEVCLLYTLRSIKLSTFSCQVSFPGGKVDKRETVFDTALRETKEEIGLSAKDIEIWTSMGQVLSLTQNMVITPVVGMIKSFDFNKLIPNENEVDEIFTIPMRIFCDTENHGYYKYKGLRGPVYTGGRHVVWGITAMITHRFLYAFLSDDLYTADFLRKRYELCELVEPDDE